jgi:hypothetical protein
VGEERVEGQATSKERSGLNEDASLHPARARRTCPGDKDGCTAGPTPLPLLAPRK